MFWSGEELDELRGASVVGTLHLLFCFTQALPGFYPPGNIGRSEAENDYHNKIVPAVKSRPDLFLPDHLEKWYTLDRYHIVGSRILSRSFQVEQWDTPANSEEDDGAPRPEMDVDPIPTEAEAGHRDEGAREADGNSDDEGSEDSGDVAMVPMADMLNARFGCNNVRCHVSVLTYI
jgi:SET domain-containing protein 6